MIVGTGLIASAFFPLAEQLNDVCIYAAGVSNSNCSDQKEFLRDELRLTNTLNQFNKNDIFVYFSTCSIFDPEAVNTFYVQHKLKMELIVQMHPKFLVLRLPQVVGKTSNPYTLLNFLFAHISCSKRFGLWQNAKRNIIDVDDLVLTTLELIKTFDKKMVYNVANPKNYSMKDIVSEMGTILGIEPIYDLVDRGTDYTIDIGESLPAMLNSGVDFSEGYLNRVLTKYYSGVTDKQRN